MRATKFKRFAAATLFFGLSVSTGMAGKVIEKQKSFPGTSFRTFISDDINNREARVVLKKALDVLGGLERLKAVSSLVFKGKGEEFRSSDLQGSSPNISVRTSHEETIAVMPSQNKALYEQRTGRHDGSFRWRKWIYSGEERTVVDLRAQFISNIRRDPASQSERARITRLVPHLLLIEAFDNVATLNWVGRRMHVGQMHDVISFPLPGTKSTLALFVAADTRLVSKYEYMMDYTGLGDALVEFVYSNYRKDAKLGWVPGGYSISLAGKAFRTIRFIETHIDSPKGMDAFLLSEQMVSLTMPVGEATEVAKGVYIFVTGSLNPMFIEFKDFILAVEAPAQAPTLERIPADSQPGSTRLSETFINKIKETIPNKPIRYLAVTHFHNDHAGGARAFMAEGSTILTTPGNREYFERLAGANYSVVPDKFSQQKGPAKIETIGDKRVITDGDRVVELFNLRNSPHATENVVVYLPKEKILFQGDLFYFAGFDQFPAKDPSRDRVMKFLGGWLMKNGLRPERIYGFHDRGFATMTQVRQVLRLKR